ncbi:hypothetical protein M427DRAFT_134528 [Gonapodya prolifera JEL478]|uniref:Pyridoxal phosphate homeostasis protein n=1 Tax=Gonapodya prolifera (strain JEL478) TaxID=1344416 RepID=A0A139AH93_GONPJ|nr:hypothetical protein M427DRAFT_134528 [Gonapodya prolifera JEL478]|eukprot:KXS16069.1 hypothetical protein M427DRAFT_134528 [Gonapodya prolifera JEL478]
MSHIAENIRDVQEKIVKASAGKQPIPRLVAVSKTKPAEDVKAAYDVGQRHFGENYVQELVEKAAQLPIDIQWHFIGHLQSNKCKALAAIPNLWVVETIDGVKKATELNKACASRASPLRIFLQINTSGEPQKGGIEPDEVTSVAHHVISNCPNLTLAGLMTIGMAEREEKPNPDFVCLTRCRDVVSAALPDLPALEVSMGMSGDFEEAVELGSTNVRVGSTIFGARNYKK